MRIFSKLNEFTFILLGQTHFLFLFFFIFSNYFMIDLGKILDFFRLFSPRGLPHILSNGLFSHLDFDSKNLVNLVSDTLWSIGLL